MNDPAEAALPNPGLPPPVPAVLTTGYPVTMPPKPRIHFQRLMDVFDLSKYPDGFVRGTLCIAVVFTAVAYFWLHTQWELPQELAVMLAAVWGLAMTLDPRSSLKGWLVLLMAGNVLLMFLILVGKDGSGWAPPTLTALAVQGLFQYVGDRMLMTEPGSVGNGAPAAMPVTVATPVE